jgi:hypothetical protein
VGVNVCYVLNCHRDHQSITYLTAHERIRCILSGRSKILVVINVYEIGRAGTPSKDLVRLLKNSVLADMYTPQGLYRGRKRICCPSDDTHTNLIIGKIVRGLHYHQAHSFVPETWEVSVFLQQVKPEHLPLFTSFPICRSARDFFTYRGVCSENRSIWYMRFYHEAYAVAIFDNLAILDGSNDIVELGDEAAPYLELPPGP